MEGNPKVGDCTSEMNDSGIWDANVLSSHLSLPCYVHGVFWLSTELERLRISTDLEVNELRLTQASLDRPEENEHELVGSAK